MSTQVVSFIVCGLLLAGAAAVGIRAPPVVPSWNMPPLDPSKPYGGAPLLPQTTYQRLHYAFADNGTYNMAPMIGLLGGQFIATWQNAPTDEAQPGQRVLVSQSNDGTEWSGPVELFPNISTESSPAILFAEPPVMINGRVYAAASPKQYCLYPDQYATVLLLRRVYTDSWGKFGDMFWAYPTAPEAYIDNTIVHNIKTLADMDPLTQQDVKVLLTNQSYAPCDAAGLNSTKGHSPKCEFCVGGCQNWNDTKGSHLGDERTHYLLPHGGGDVLLYKNRERVLAASVRENVGEEWQGPFDTNISSAISNLNAGNLRDGRAFLVWNALATKRDPLYLAITDKTNVAFVDIYVVASCKMKAFEGPGQPDGCKMRYQGGEKKAGVMYPQSMEVVEGTFYVIFSLNKEDIWLSKTPMSVINAF